MSTTIYTQAKKIKNKLGKRFKFRNIACPRIVEKEEQKFYISYLSEGMTAFDVGANIGEISLLFSRFVGLSGQVHSFEASSQTFQKLSTVCSIAHRSQITLTHAAVSNQEGTLALNVYDESHSGWNTIADRPLEAYGIDVKPVKRETVPAITLDSYCREKNISCIDLLKIDVEGAEYQVMLGAKELFKDQKIKCCVFEFGATTFDMGNIPEQIETFLRSYGYGIKNVVKNNPNFPGGQSAKTACFSLHVAVPLK